ncbi:MAG: carboxypeptidase-like regulatory domain-containing protein, partial [Bacteroidales bacterium]|nr:carboxypeptidase-like regulatory domain-containing protein [Bacteroidales bacterium]
EPLIGVSVVEVGTTNGTITDLDGNFSLKVSEGSQIIFSFMGYQSQTLPASSTMKVVMSEDTFF